MVRCTSHYSGSCGEILKSVLLFSVESVNSDIHLNKLFSAKNRNISDNRVYIFDFFPLTILLELNHPGKVPILIEVTVLSSAL